MSTGRNLLWIGIVALLGFIVWQEARFSRQLRVMHALYAERQVQLAEAKQPDSTTSLAGQLEATRSQLLETRADLVTARRQLTNNANQIAALERQMQAFTRQAPPARSLRSVAFTEDGTGLVVDAQPVVTRGRPWGE
jgi:septal ring factor EnvC (AmiA/AmiB activator)